MTIDYDMFPSKAVLGDGTTYHLTELEGKGYYHTELDSANINEWWMCCVDKKRDKPFFCHRGSGKRVWRLPFKVDPDYKAHSRLSSGGTAAEDTQRESADVQREEAPAVRVKGVTTTTLLPETDTAHHNQQGGPAAATTRDNGSQDSPNMIRGTARQAAAPAGVRGVLSGRLAQIAISGDDSDTEERSRSAQAPKRGAFHRSPSSSPKGAVTNIRKEAAPKGGDTKQSPSNAGGGSINEASTSSSRLDIESEIQRKLAQRMKAMTGQKPSTSTSTVEGTTMKGSQEVESVGDNGSKSGSPKLESASVEAGTRQDEAPAQPLVEDAAPSATAPSSLDTSQLSTGSSRVSEIRQRLRERRDRRGGSDAGGSAANSDSESGAAMKASGPTKPPKAVSPEQAEAMRLAASVQEVHAAVMGIGAPAPASIPAATTPVAQEGIADEQQPAVVDEEKKTPLVKSPLQVAAKVVPVVARVEEVKKPLSVSAPSVPTPAKEAADNGVKGDPGNKGKLLERLEQAEALYERRRQAALLSGEQQLESNRQAAHDDSQLATLPQSSDIVAESNNYTSYVPDQRWHGTEGEVVGVYGDAVVHSTTSIYTPDSDTSATALEPYSGDSSRATNRPGKTPVTRQAGSALQSALATARSKSTRAPTSSTNTGDNSMKSHDGHHGGDLEMVRHAALREKIARGQAEMQQRAEAFYKAAAQTPNRSFAGGPRAIEQLDVHSVGSDNDSPRGLMTPRSQHRTDPHRPRTPILSRHDRVDYGGGFWYEGGVADSTLPVRPGAKKHLPVALKHGVGRFAFGTVGTSDSVAGVNSKSAKKGKSTNVSAFGRGTNNTSAMSERSVSDRSTAASGRPIMYEGSFSEDKIEGPGVMTGLLKGSTSYDGLWYKDLPHDREGELLVGEAMTVKGGFEHGKASGVVSARFPEGDVFDGKARNNQLLDGGRMFCVNGDVIEWIEEVSGDVGGHHSLTVQGSATKHTPARDDPSGLTEADAVTGGRAGTGKATVHYTNGEIYSGEIVGYRRHGVGVFRFVDGHEYAGEFRGGAMHGKGKFVFSSGAVYEGDFAQNRFHGHGYYRASHGDYEYVGLWNKGMMHGQGVLTYKNGDEWRGIFEKDHQKRGRYTTSKEFQL